MGSQRIRRDWSDVMHAQWAKIKNTVWSLRSSGPNAPPTEVHGSVSACSSPPPHPDEEGPGCGQWPEPEPWVDVEVESQSVWPSVGPVCEHLAEAGSWGEATKASRGRTLLWDAMKLKSVWESGPRHSLHSLDYTAWEAWGLLRGLASTLCVNLLSEAAADQRPVNYCETGLHDCDISQRAQCIYTGGSSYTCSCLPGFSGDGRACRGAWLLWPSCLCRLRKCPGWCSSLLTHLWIQEN